MTFHPDQLGDLSGKVYIVTGGNAGMSVLSSLPFPLLPSPSLPLPILSFPLKSILTPFLQRIPQLSPPRRPQRKSLPLRPLFYQRPHRHQLHKSLPPFRRSPPPSNRPPQPLQRPHRRPNDPIFRNQASWVIEQRRHNGRSPGPVP